MAIIHDHHHVRGQGDVIHEVRGDDDNPFSAQRDDVLTKAGPFGGIQPDGWLVKDDDRWVVHQSCGEEYPLALSTGQGTHRASQELGGTGHLDCCVDESVDP